MRTRIFFLPILLVSITTIAQEAKRIGSLEDFFGGIPLKEKYNAWVLYLNGEPGLGIDSIDKKGAYSSYKQERTNHFPFPDSIPVKILLYTGIETDTSGKFPVDTIISVTIEGVFGNSKKAKKNSDQFFKQLRSILLSFYDIKYAWKEAISFANGINEKFPNVLLQKGYLKDKKFYYVLLYYEIRKQTVLKINTQ